MTEKMRDESVALTGHDPLLSPSDFWRYLNIGRRTFCTWRAAGKLPAPDLAEGRIIRWRMSTIEEWLAGRNQARGLGARP